MGATVVGKPAATVMTSSPGCDRRSPSFELVSAEKASKIRGRTGIDEDGFFDAEKCRQLIFKRVAFRPQREPEIERRIDRSGHFLFSENAAGIRNGCLCRE